MRRKSTVNQTKMAISINTIQVLEKTAAMNRFDELMIEEERKGWPEFQRFKK
jgi:hypothetical protein